MLTHPNDSPKCQATTRTAHGRATIVVLFSAVLHWARCHQQAPSVTVALPAWAVNALTKDSLSSAISDRTPQQQLTALHSKCSWEKTYSILKKKKKAHKFLYYRTFFSLLSASYYITIVSCSSMHSFPYTACHFVISYI